MYIIEVMNGEAPVVIVWRASIKELQGGKIPLVQVGAIALAENEDVMSTIDETFEAGDITSYTVEGLESVRRVLHMIMMENGATLAGADAIVTVMVKEIEERELNLDQRSVPAEQNYRMN